MNAIGRTAQGGHIDRDKPLTFTLNGKSYVGYEGDTLASALLANGVKVIGRSFKLHRPRGLVGSGAEEPNAIMTVGSGAFVDPNARATQVELYDGLVARTTKGWPGVNFDVAEINDVFSRLFGAGFYYKTFMRPRRLWHWYEKIIRRSAGFSKAPDEADDDSYQHSNAHCDVLIAGAGVAGIAAALVAGRAGARVIIADEQVEAGGMLLSTRVDIGGEPAAVWLRDALQELDALPNVTRLQRSTVAASVDHGFSVIVERLTDHVGPQHRRGPRQRLWRVRAKQRIFAQGAFERPLAFCNNDRPGVMLASAVQTYIRRYAVCPWQRAVIFTNNDSAYEAALALHDAGVTVAAIVDSRRQGAAPSQVARMASQSIPVMNGHVVCNVRGRRAVTGVDIAVFDSTESVQPSIHMQCDLLLMSGGWSPAVHLHSQAGGRNRWDDEWQCFLPDQCPEGVASAGSGNGCWTIDDCLHDGAEKGADAAVGCGFDVQAAQFPASNESPPASIEPLWRVPAEKDADHCAKQFLDFQNDTSVADVRLAVREGYRNVEHVKRYTALGFGTDQGKLGNINGMAVLAECLGKPIPEVGTTTFRPAYTPVTFGVLAGENVGELLDPVRTTAIHSWHQERGAPMENVGQWHRPWYFPLAGEDLHAAVARECLAVRQSVGIMDASTLGKIDVSGPDACEFLERVYTHNIAKMKVGKCAYGVLLGEDGMLMDDGVMARTGDNRYYLTTTTGGAAQVLSWLELWLQTEWPELDVYLTSLTDQYSTIAVAGPNSRRVLENAGCDIDLARDAFPFMTVQDATLAGHKVQLFRVSFSGELAFEVNVDSRYALEMWQALMSAGEAFDITPYGTETMHVLRAEKGFVIIGQDTDGSVTPVDAGMSWLLAKDKDFLGKRSLARPDCVRDGRKQLVGLESIDEKTVVAEGAQLVVNDAAAKPIAICGHVSSSYFSASLNKPIALALLEDGRKRHGETLTSIDASGSAVDVRVVAPVFYDPKGTQQHV